MWALLTFAAVAFLADQTTKRMVPAGIARSFGGPLVYIRQVQHHARLYYRPLFRTALVILWLFAALAAVWLQRSGQLLHGPLAEVGLGCALGGAAGNLLDILRRRHVVDFIDLGWWPVFNLADVAIVAGLLLAFLGTVPRT